MGCPTLGRADGLRTTATPSVTVLETGGLVVLVRCGGFCAGSGTPTWGRQGLTPTGSGSIASLSDLRSCAARLAEAGSTCGSMTPGAGSTRGSGRPDLGTMDRARKVNRELAEVTEDPISSTVSRRSRTRT